MSNVRTRFAPSPTGSLHVGGVRTALYCLLFARKHGGTFVLRIEDTDQTRSTEEAAVGIMTDLRWLGLRWDEGPEEGGELGSYFQSRRLALYQRYIKQLLDEGKAYEAWDTREELQAMREAARAQKRDFAYRGGPVSDEQREAYVAEGRKPVVRFKMPDEDVTILDQVQGEVTVPSHRMDDIVIQKADGWPTYHLAVVVDDHHMQISHVTRGRDHLNNTHKHRQLYRAFGWEFPHHAHLSTINNMSGGRMSKRDKAKEARQALREHVKTLGLGKGEVGDLPEQWAIDPELLRRFLAKKSDDVPTAEAIAKHLGVELPFIEVADFRKGGFLPEALLNYLALLGWSPGDDREIMTFDEMVEAFSLERVVKTDAKFDLKKLTSFNRTYIKDLPLDVVHAHFETWLAHRDSPIQSFDEDRRRALVAMYQGRANTFVDLEQQASFLWTAPTEYDPKAVRKRLDGNDGWSRLDQVTAALADVGRWEAPSLVKALEDLCESTGATIDKFAQPIRVALTGTGTSPAIGDTLAFLGRDESIERMKRCLSNRPTE
ncbi:MAG: glutamate--tRNA ligase [Myxococcota bacterium]